MVISAKVEFYVEDCTTALNLRAGERREFLCNRVEDPLLQCPVHHHKVKRHFIIRHPVLPQKPIELGVMYGETVAKTAIRQDDGLHCTAGLKIRKLLLFLNDDGSKNPFRRR